MDDGGFLFRLGIHLGLLEVDLLHGKGVHEVVHLHLIGSLKREHCLVVLVHHADDCVLY